MTPIDAECMVGVMDQQAIAELLKLIQQSEPKLRLAVAQAVYPEGFPKRVDRFIALREAYAMARVAGDHKTMASIACQL